MKKIWWKQSPRASLPLPSLLALLLCSPAWADISRLPTGRPLPTLIPLTTVTQSGGTELSFVKQVGQVLSRYSSRTEYEACANLCRSPAGNWVAEVVTIGSHSSCMVSNRCPVGTRDIGRLIHSHPASRSFIANEVDFQAWGKPYIPNTRVQADDPGLFSESDFSRPGYLVVNGQLHYQEGPHAIRSLGSIASP